MAKKSEKIAETTDFSSLFYTEIEKIKEKFKLGDKELLHLLSEQKKEKIPISIFKQKTLSSFESIVKYFRENKQLNFREIGELLNRSKFTIAATYSKAKQKMPYNFSVSFSPYDIPIEIIANRKLSVLESIVSYLKTKFNLRYNEIAELLNLDQRTIWTVYSRARRKSESNTNNKTEKTDAKQQ